MVKDAKTFFIGAPQVSFLWPFLANAAAHDALTHQSSPSWRSGRVLVGEKDSFQVLTVDSPLYSDGSEHHFPEVLGAKSGFPLPVGFLDNAVSSAHTIVSGPNGLTIFCGTKDEYEAFEGSSLAQWLMATDSVDCFYTNETTVSVVFNATEFDEELNECLTQLRESISQAMRLTPRQSQ